MKVAEAVGRALASLGVDAVFGLLGSGNLTNPEALGSILFFVLGAAAADVLGQAVGAVVLSSSSRWDRRMSFWRTDSSVR